MGLMNRLFVLLTLMVPALALGDVWRWKDAGGRLHYSNVAAHAPSGASLVAGSLGRIEAEPAPTGPVAMAGQRELAGFEQIRRERELRRRLDAIEHAKAQLEATRRAHYQRLYGDAITPPPIPAARIDRWQALGAEEARLKQLLGVRD